MGPYSQITLIILSLGVPSARAFTKTCGPTEIQKPSFGALDTSAFHKIYQESPTVKPATEIQNIWTGGEIDTSEAEMFRGKTEKEMVEIMEKNFAMKVIVGNDMSPESGVKLSVNTLGARPSIDSEAESTDPQLFKHNSQLDGVNTIEDKKVVEFYKKYFDEFKIARGMSLFAGQVPESLRAALLAIKQNPDDPKVRARFFLDTRRIFVKGNASRNTLLHEFIHHRLANRNDSVHWEDYANQAKKLDSPEFKNQEENLSESNAGEYLDTWSEALEGLAHTAGEEMDVNRATFTLGNSFGYPEADQRLSFHLHGVYLDIAKAKAEQLRAQIPHLEKLSLSNRSIFDKLTSLKSRLADFDSKIKASEQWRLSIRS